MRRRGRCQGAELEPADPHGPESTERREVTRRWSSPRPARLPASPAQGFGPALPTPSSARPSTLADGTAGSWPRGVWAWTIRPTHPPREQGGRVGNSRTYGSWPDSAARVTGSRAIISPRLVSAPGGGGLRAGSGPRRGRRPKPTARARQGTASPDGGPGPARWSQGGTGRRARGGIDAGRGRLGSTTVDGSVAGCSRSVASHRMRRAASRPSCRTPDHGSRLVAPAAKPTALPPPTPRRPEHSTGRDEPSTRPDISNTDPGHHGDPPPVVTADPPEAAPSLLPGAASACYKWNGFAQPAWNGPHDRTRVLVWRGSTREFIAKRFGHARTARARPGERDRQRGPPVLGQRQRRRGTARSNARRRRNPSARGGTGRR